MLAKNGLAATITRRTHMAQLAGFGAVMFGDGASAAASRLWDVPAEGMGQNIRHVSFSDMGGKPDGVQIMPNRGHLYIGHQFNDGLTVIDASDPRNLKTVNYFTTGPNTRAPHLQVANDIMVVGNGANPNAMQSYTDARSYFENKFADSITKKLPLPCRAVGARHQNRSGASAGNRVSGHARARHQSPVVDGWAVCLCCRAFRRLHRPHPLHC